MQNIQKELSCGGWNCLLGPLWLVGTVTTQEKGGPKMQDTETDDKSNKGQALMKADKKYRKPKIRNPEYEKTKAGRKH